MIALRHLHRPVGLLASLTSLLGASSALGSPWTLPRGQLVLSTAFDAQYATTEFVDRGGERAFPLDGEQTAAGVTLSARYGLTDAIELEVVLPVRLLSYRSDPVILRDPPVGLPDLEARRFFQDNVLDFSQTTGGLGDIALRARHRLTTGAFVSAVQVGLVTPTGYRGPEGTFGSEPDSPRPLSEIADRVRPENVRDDVVLGDGRLELEAGLLIGTALPTGTLLRAGGGYALRLGGAGDQVRADLRLGQALGPRVLVFASGRLTVTVEEGDSIGLTAVAVDPELPARRFLDAPGLNLRLVERRLERDALDVGGGVLWRIADDLEMNVTYERTVWGRFTAATNAVAVSFAFRSRP